MRSPLAAGPMVVLLTTISIPVWAQTPRVAGVSVERFSVEDYRFFTVEYRRTNLREGTLSTGMDFTLGLEPRTLAGGTALLQVDAGIARALPVGPATLLLKGGVGNFLAVGSQMELYPGVQGGLAVILPLQKRARVRLDLTRHYYFGDEPLALWGLGLGLAVNHP
jgi:hypothetical protein